MRNKLIVLMSVLVISTALAGCGSAKATEIKTKEQPKTEINYYFSQDQGNPDKQLIDVIKKSKNTLDIAIYSLTKKDIVQAIIDAKKRGVNVRLITDKAEASKKAQKAELKLIKDANISVKENTHQGLMHLKVTIADKSIVTTGSYNYTEGATSLNDEVLVVIKDKSAAEKFSSEFERMWNDTKNFKEY
jgi:phosphatidylserine/phosphatidylglycerophosphate/cardiolipin synthase-like enzyme